MRTTSVVLALLTTIICCQASHDKVTPSPGKPINTQGNTSSTHGLSVDKHDTTTKRFILKNVIATAKGDIKDLSTLHRKQQHSSNINNHNNLQHVKNHNKYSMNEPEVLRNGKAQSSLKDIKNHANTYAGIWNSSRNHIDKNARIGHRNYMMRLPNTAKHYTLPGKSTGQASGKIMRLRTSVRFHTNPGKSIGEVFGKGVTLLASGLKTGRSHNNQTSFVNLKGERRRPNLNNNFYKNVNKMINKSLMKKHTRRHVKDRKNNKLRKISKKSVISGSKKVTMKQNNVFSKEHVRLNNVHITKKKRQHRHHHHRHHRRRHRHHHFEQGVSNKKKQQGSSKPNGGYQLAPPMMVTPKPTPTKQQPKIFKVQKKVTYKGHDQQAEKRFVIVGGVQGLRHLNRFHFSPALVNALKLVLNKKNYFKKDADILNLAKALETKNTNDDVPKNNSITTAVSSGKTQNGQPARLVTVKDPGYINPKGQKGGSNDFQVHRDKGPATTKAQMSGQEHDKKPHPDNVPGLVQALKASQRKGPQKTIGDTISKEPAPQVLGQAAYRSKISDDHAHSTLVDPTSLGISILKLLFGKRANLVVKPKFKMLVNGRPDMKYLQGYGSPKQRTELQKEIEEDNKLMLLKGSHKEVFEATLAKSISNLITALNKNDKTTSTETQSVQNQKKTKANDQSKTSTQEPAHDQDAKAKRNNTQEQGTRKSWVLLKMPKTGEKEDENVEKYQDKEAELKQDAIKLIATVGKHNNMMSESNNRKLLEDDGMNSIKTPKESEDDTPAKEVSPISYNLSGIKTKNELSKTSSTSDASSVETSLSKILKGIQDSIKELKEQRKDSHSDDKIKVTSYPSHTALKSSDTSPMPFTSSDTSRASAVAKIPDLLAAVNNLLGSESHKSPLGVPGLPSDEATPIGRNPSVSNPSDATRRYVSNVRASNDPLLPKPDVYDEPITTVSHSKAPRGQGPSDNVLFESDEMATQRDEQNSVAAMKLKEDLESFAEKGLNAHNKYRALHHSPNLKWSDELATQAEKLAYEMAMKGTIEKSSLATSFNYGENVAKISGTTFDRAGEEATSLWYGEVSNYSFSDPRITPQTDSFTQVVWKSSAKLGMGCARDLQTNDLYVVALYDPKGNEEMGLRTNVLNKGQLTEDVYASIFKRHKLQSKA